ncbi:hypothetical protein AAVH_08716 [Aphelenchoides avenae]|nr:hypothetical protein AAVH_08716 [Aphelenchus avenae]
MRHRKTRHYVPFEISLEADVADAPVPAAPPVQPPLRQYTCSCCNLNLSDVMQLSVFEKSLVLQSTDNKLHLVDLSEPAYWGLLNAFVHRLPETSVQRTISFVAPRLKRTTLDQLAFYLARVPNVTTFVYPRTVVDEFTLATCRQQLEAHLKTLRSVANVPKWTHVPTSLIAKGKRFVAGTDIDPITLCTPDDHVTFEIRSSSVLRLLYEVQDTSARFLPRKVTIRVDRHFASDDLETLTDALNDGENVFTFAEEFQLLLHHTPPAIASLNETEGFAITIAQQLSALEFALRIWLSGAPLQRRWTTEIHGDLRAHRVITSQEYPIILQKLGRSLQTPFTIRSLRRTDAVRTTEIRSTVPSSPATHLRCQRYAKPQT